MSRGPERCTIDALGFLPLELHTFLEGEGVVDRNPRPLQPAGFPRLMLHTFLGGEGGSLTETVVLFSPRFISKLADFE